MKHIGMISFGNVLQPRNGYALRCWMLAKKLAGEGNTVTIFQFTAEDRQDMREDIAVYSLGVKHERPSSSRLARILGFDPLRELVFPFEGYRKLKQHQALLAGADELYIEGCLLLNAVAYARKHRMPVVLDTHCINKDVALKLRRQSPFVGAIRVGIWHLLESSVLNRSGRIIAISPNDKAFIEQHYRIDPARIEIIGHSVDKANAAKYEQAARELRARLSNGYRKVACFIGDLGAIQNIESEKYIRNTLAPSTPDVHYVLVGNNPAKHPSRDNITFTGFVDSIDPYILAADFCIAPVTIGSGIKTKVLDYMKYKKPVVATPVAMEGIEPDHTTAVHAIEDFITGVKYIAGEQT